MRRIAHPEPLAILRAETAAANRDKHEVAYFQHVILPLAMAGYPYPKAQALLIPGRRFRIDYAYIDQRLAIEIQGQIWRKGGHTTGKGITRDAEKYNELAAIHWRLILITPEMIEDGRALEFTRKALRRVA